jgi:ABC-type cobalt transport system, ATPase component
MIRLQGIGFSYPDSPAIADVDLDIGRGEALALIGPNGCGKSTLLKLLNGLVFPDVGTYTFDGERISRERLKEQSFAKRFHQRIGFLFQNSEAQLFCGSVYDEIAFGPRQMGMDESAVAGRVEDMLALLDIGGLRDRIPYHLSGGEKRKVALASVLALNPEVLALDEPMNGLDPKTKRFLRDFLASMRSAGKTIVCATHDFEYVDGLFDRAAAFSAEHVLSRVGPYRELLEDREFLEEQNIV